MIDKFKANFLEAGYMQTSGSALLKLMQNKETPVLDLFVRESIQNSLDASLQDSEEVMVDFKSGSFSVESLTKKYCEIADGLLEKYKDLNDYISISDKNTIGLVGNKDGLFDKGEENQNLGKLVFQIMDPQTKSGSGGCWGIGKTVYYRLGIGLVIYYTRIKTLEGYEERIISTLVEDEQSENRLIKNQNRYIGITYFGDISDCNKPCVICDPNFIHELLKIFNIKPYINNETGTVIIVPFVNKKKLLNDRKYDYGDKPYWESTIPDYLRMSTLRWYFPRISCKYNYKPFLTTKVNDVLVSPNENTPLFSKLTEMYECIINQQEKEGIKIFPIERNNKDLQDKCLGYFAYTKVTKFEMKMTGSGCDANLPSPFCFANTKNDDTDQNPPIITFCRKPGMIVSYETASNWTGSGVTGQESYIIGLFVLNSYNKFSNSQLTLEDYVRGSERADHTSWIDYPIEGFKTQKWIVNNITNAIGNKLKEVYVVKQDIGEEISTNRILGKRFADLLPSYNYGKESSIDGRGRSTNSISKGKFTTVKLLGKPIFDSKGMKLCFEIICKKRFKELQLCLQLETTSNSISINKWEDDGLNKICSINKMFSVIEKVYPKDLSYKANNLIITKKDIVQDKLKIELLKTKSHICYGFKILNLGVDSFKLNISMELEVFDYNYLISFISSIDEEDEK